MAAVIVNNLKLTLFRTIELRSAVALDSIPSISAANSLVSSSCDTRPTAAAAVRRQFSSAAAIPLVFPFVQLNAPTTAADIIRRPFHATAVVTSSRRFKKAGDVEAASKARREERWQPTKTGAPNEAPSAESTMTPEELERWLKKRPVDDVWLQKHYPERSFQLDKVVEMNRQANHPSMLDSPDGDVMVELSLNMQGLKATKPIKSFSVLTHLPHKSPHSTCAPRDVAVLVKNVELQQQMEAKGARFVGGEELLLKIKGGLIQKDSDYDYLVAHMDMIQDLGAHLKKKHSYLMPTERDGTLGVDLHEMFDLHQNGYLLQVKSNGHDPMTGSVTFSLGKLSHSLPKMLENLDVLMRILRVKRPANLTPKRGVFITDAAIKCPPNTEIFKWDFTPLNDFMDSTNKSVFHEDAVDEERSSLP